MRMYTTKPVKELTAIEYKDILKDKDIIISPHALWHLSMKQRKVFNEEELLNTLNRENPRKAYLQENGRYAAYYRKKDGFRKIIIEVNGKIIIVSFMDMLELPKLT